LATICPTLYFLAAAIPFTGPLTFFRTLREMDQFSGAGHNHLRLDRRAASANRELNFSQQTHSKSTRLTSQPC